MGAFPKLIAAEAEVAIYTSGFASGPAAITHAARGTVTGKCLDLAVDLKALHGVFCCMEGGHQGGPLG